MRKKTKRRRGLPRGAHRVRIEVVPGSAKTWPWRYTVEGKLRGGSIQKRRAVGAAVTLAREIAERGGFASVRVHDRKGKFEWEMTYPRWSDKFPPRG